MNDEFLSMAGTIAVLISIAHGLSGEIRVFARATIEPPQLRTLLRLVWQAGTIAWIGAGVLLGAAPLMASDEARHWIVATCAAVFGFAAVANAWATRGRHFGWAAMTVVVALAVAGY